MAKAYEIIVIEMKGVANQLALPLGKNTKVIKDQTIADLEKLGLTFDHAESTLSTFVPATAKGHRPHLQRTRKLYFRADSSWLGI